MKHQKPTPKVGQSEACQNVLEKTGNADSEESEKNYLLQLLWIKWSWYISVILFWFSLSYLFHDQDDSGLALLCSASYFWQSLIKPCQGRHSLTCRSYFICHLTAKRAAKRSTKILFFFSWKCSNAFYFMLKALFILEISTPLSWPVGHAEK